MNIKTFILVFFALIPNLLIGQDDDWYEEESTEPSLYEVVNNDKDLVGLIRIADHKLVIPYNYQAITVEPAYEGNDENYAEVTSTSGLIGIYSVKVNKEIIPCKYKSIELFYNDFYPNDDENPLLLCAFIAGTGDESSDVKDYYALNGQLIISTDNEVEWNLEKFPDMIMGLIYTYNDYSEMNGYFIYNRLTGKIFQNRKCEIYEHGSIGQLIIKVGNKVGVIDELSGNYIIKPEYDSISGFPAYLAFKDGRSDLLIAKGMWFFRQVCMTK